MRNLLDKLTAMTGGSWRQYILLVTGLSLISIALTLGIWAATS